MNEKVYCIKCKYFQEGHTPHRDGMTYKCTKRLKVKNKIDFIHPPDDDSGFINIEDVTLQKNYLGNCPYYTKKETFIGKLRKLFKY